MRSKSHAFQILSCATGVLFSPIDCLEKMPPSRERNGVRRCCGNCRGPPAAKQNLIAMSGTVPALSLKGGAGAGWQVPWGHPGWSPKIGSSLVHRWCAIVSSIHSRIPSSYSTPMCCSTAIISPSHSLSREKLLHLMGAWLSAGCPEIGWKVLGFPWSIQLTRACGSRPLFLSFEIRSRVRYFAFVLPQPGFLSRPFPRVRE